jgi:hypothetical protein
VRRDPMTDWWFDMFLRLGRPLTEQIIAVVEDLPDHLRARYGPSLQRVTKPPITSRWFRLREAVASAIAPPIPPQTTVHIILSRTGKIRVRP